MTNFLLVPVWVALTMGIALSATGKLSGWSKLAEKYPVRSEFKGVWNTFQFARINWAGYKGCMWIGTTDDAVYLKTGPWKFFALGHPEMQIPWSALEVIGPYKFFGHSYIRVSPRSMPDIVVSLPEKVVADYCSKLPRRGA